jgi:pimeloyl-ACP methyl ester carboxylesterase
LFVLKVDEGQIIMQGSQTAIAQRSVEKYAFDHKDMDYYFSWILGRHAYDGSDERECFDTASQIVDGDAQSWHEAWLKLAQQIEQQADAAFKQGDPEHARKAYLRASTYYRAPLFMMSPEDAAFRENVGKMQACFRQAAKLFDPPIEAIHVPFQGKRLAGYVWKKDSSDQKRPTLLVIGGLETFAEDCYFMVGPSATRRGYNVITADLSGQGMNPDQGLIFEARMERSVSAVVDYALSRPDVSPEQLGLFGFSWGGHIVFKGAHHDRRIKALIANPAMPDVFRAARAQQGHRGKGDAVSKLVFAQIVWRMGLKISFNPADIGRRFAKAYDYLRYGKADPRQIQCPTLCMAGEGEAKITLDIAQECIAKLPNPKSKLVTFTRAQRGEAHCQVNNLPLPNETMLDWLESVFASQ